MSWPRRPRCIRRPAEELEPPSQKTDPVSHIDLVEIARALEVDDAETYELLREMGLDNKSLLKVMHALGTDERMIKTVKHIAEAGAKIEAEARRRHEEITLQLAEGRLTAEEAKAQTRQLHDRAMSHFVEVQKRAVQKQGHDEKAVHADRLRQHAAELQAARTRLESMHRHIDQELEAGRISEEEAERHMQELHLKATELQAAHDHLEEEM
ncbi:MAG: hypothetical protein ACYTGC_20170, partial [Planctomycetota bacterium]